MTSWEDLQTRGEVCDSIVLFIGNTSAVTAMSPAFDGVAHGRLPSWAPLRYSLLGALLSFWLVTQTSVLGAYPYPGSRLLHTDVQDKRTAALSDDVPDIPAACIAIEGIVHPYLSSILTTRTSPVLLTLPP